MLLYSRVHSEVPRCICLEYCVFLRRHHSWKMGTSMAGHKSLQRRLTCFMPKASKETEKKKSGRRNGEKSMRQNSEGEVNDQKIMFDLLQTMNKSLDVIWHDQILTSERLVRLEGVIAE